METPGNQTKWILSALIVLQLGFLSSLFFRAVADGRYFLFQEDEVINYSGSRLFAETGSLRAEGCIEENVSHIGEMNWYGPGYQVFYGSIARWFGNSPSLFVQTHFVVSLFTLGLIFLFPISIQEKLFVAASLSLCQPFTVYLFSYYPESFNLCVAALLIFLMLKVDQSQSTKRTLFIGLTVTTVLVFVLFRVTTVFWLAGLVALSRSRKEFWQMLSVAVIALIGTLAFMRLFTAPPYAGEMHKIDMLYSFSLFDFIWQTAKAIVRNGLHLLTSGSVPVYFSLSLFVLLAIQWRKTRERFSLAVLTIVVVMVIAFMAFYSADPWYFLKQSSGLVPLLLTGVMISGASIRMKFGVVALMVISFLFSYPELSDQIGRHREGWTALTQNQQFVASLNRMRDLINDDKPVTVVWCYNEHAYGVATEALLPFSTKKGYPILYSTNIVGGDASSDVRFKLHGRLPVGYIMSRHPITGALHLPVLTELYADEFYHFYKVDGHRP